MGLTPNGPNMKLILALLLLALSPTAVSYSCWSCASSLVVHSGPSKLQVDPYRLTSSDSACLANYTANQHTTPCASNACITINITRRTSYEEMDEVRPSVGVLRDCATTYSKAIRQLEVDMEYSPSSASRKQVRSLEHLNGRCFSHEMRQPRGSYNATYCICTGDYCNGKPPTQRDYHRRRNSARASPDGTPGAGPTVKPLLLPGLIYFLSTIY